MKRFWQSIESKKTHNYSGLTYESIFKSLQTLSDRSRIEIFNINPLHFFTKR